MADLKTQPTGHSVEAFLNAIPEEKKREDCFTILRIIREATGNEPEMWSDNIVGFGRYHYRYATGRTGEWMLTGFSPRKQNLTLNIMAGFDRYDELLQRLGKHTTGKSCLYIKRLSDVDQVVLKELATQSVAHMKASNP